ncbi:hypothetical protein [Synechococcus sp. 8F6]|uniref:hypothetical protein n=1 Tax=Synechococcus sp. 8F6 TaxID=2025606 RepID=UPI001E2D1AA9|nr:hypothetical protein [Synechococcus sp. 8F6]
MRPISFATPTNPPRVEHHQADEPQTSAPSFLIPGASAKAAPGLRLDQINSQLVIQAARRVLFQALNNASAGADPAGVVLHGNQGRLVFDLPVLLPDEHFVPIDLIRGRLGRSGGSRLRLPRKPSSMPPA